MELEKEQKFLKYITEEKAKARTQKRKSNNSHYLLYET